MLSGTSKTQVQDRLRRIAGQVAGIQRMVEEERYCVDVLLQIAAVQAALGGVGKLVLGAHVDTCVAEAIAGGDEGAARQKVDELMQVFSRFGAFRQR